MPAKMKDMATTTRKISDASKTFFVANPLMIPTMTTVIMQAYTVLRKPATSSCVFDLHLKQTMMS